METIYPPAHEMVATLEHSAEVPPNEVNGALGYLALNAAANGESIGEDYVNEGIAKLEAAANGESIGEDYVNEGIAKLEAAANGESIGENTRIHDVNDAHTAALIENEIFDAHTAALIENEIFDAHVAANRENDQRKENQNLNPEKGVETDNNSPQELHKEAVSALKQLGLDTKLPPSSIITKNASGDLLIVGNNNAMVITQFADGKPKMTEYRYNKNTKVLTVDNRRFDVSADRIYGNQPTYATELQISKVVIPPVIAKRFGID